MTNYYEKYSSQLDVVYKLIDLLDDDSWSTPGLQEVVYINTYLLACYLIEWVGWEEHKHLGNRDMENYIQIIREHDYFRCENLKDLLRYDTELCYFEGLHKCEVEFDVLPPEVVSTIIDHISYSGRAFYSAYMR